MMTLGPTACARTSRAAVATIAARAIKDTYFTFDLLSAP
jgi:hypothetical protein